MDYFEQDEDKDRLKDLIIEVLEIQDERYETNPAIAEVLAKVDRDLFIQIQETPPTIPDRKNNTLKLWFKIATVAASLVLISIGIYFFNHRPVTPTAIVKVEEQEINPGDFGATLTMANGK